MYINITPKMFTNKMFVQKILRIRSNSRLFSVSTQCMLDQRWRKERGLPLNPNAEGILVQKPDYTFLDGRPTPYGSRQKNRILKQKDYGEKIITLSKEIDFAIERHDQNIVAEKKRKQDIIDNKLKPKGQLLLNKT